MEFRFAKGRDIDLGPAPDNQSAMLRPTGLVGLSAQDFPGTAFDLRVREGQDVRCGQVLCVDRLCPDIAFVASASGRVSQIHHGTRHRIHALEIATEGDELTRFDVKPAQNDPKALRSLLLESGAWVAFRSRPYGRIPAPSDRPSAIFVTASDSNPLAADPAAILASQPAAFQRGVDAMIQLTEGPVFVCQAFGAALAEPRERVRVVRFSGPHPSGLAGTHVHHLMPVSGSRMVWQIGYQDVAAIGHLLETGRNDTLRTVSVAGPGLMEPALVIAPLGAQLSDLVQETSLVPTKSAPRLVSGSVLTGRTSRFLGRHDVQVTVLANDRDALSARPFWARILDRLPRTRTGATLPFEAFERAFPFDMLPVPLMRALAVGDVETAEKLGCLELLEEDMALLSWLCPSGCDYGALLRHSLDVLAEERRA